MAHVDASKAAALYRLVLLTSILLNIAATSAERALMFHRARVPEGMVALFHGDDDDPDDDERDG